MKGLLIFFLQTFVLTFTGFVLSNVCAVAIENAGCGFASLPEQLADLPYLLYLVFALIISAILTLTLYSKTRS